MRHPHLAAALGATVWCASVTCAAAAIVPTGEAMFAQNCSACHQLTGKGVPGAFPQLVGDPIVLGPSDKLSALVLRGRGGMPSFKADLTDEQIAPILTYVRSAWGNHAPAIAPAVVRTARGSNAPAPPSQAIQAH